MRVRMLVEKRPTYRTCGKGRQCSHAFSYICTTKPILDALFRIGNISAPIIIGNEKVALARSAGGCKRPRDVAPDKAPSMMGSDPQTRCICTCTRAETRDSFPRAPLARLFNTVHRIMQIHPARWLHRDIAPRRPILFFFYLLLFYAEAVRWATRRENDHEPRVLRDVTWWWNTSCSRLARGLSNVSRLSIGLR